MFGFLMLLEIQILICRIVGGVLIESFYVAFFQKATANPTRVALVAPRKARNLFWRFSFVSFSFAPTASKEKRKAV